MFIFILIHNYFVYMYSFIVYKGVYIMYKGVYIELLYTFIVIKSFAKVKVDIWVSTIPHICLYILLI